MLSFGRRVGFSVFFAGAITISTTSPALDLPANPNDHIQTAPLVVGSIGDSISVAFNSANWGNNTSLSWATGDNVAVNSVALRLKNSQSAVVNSFNFSVPAANARDLPDQITKLMAKEPNFVTLLIGANDLCEWNADHHEQLLAFESSLKSAITSMIEMKSDVKILLSSLPDMHRMYEVGMEKGCTERWRTFGICKPLLGSDLTDLDRQLFVERWHDANTSLATIAAQYADNVEFLGGVQNYQFGVGDISGKDCFHPSAGGQTTLAREAWNSRWFSDYAGK
jgi:lysophospholipase L1-like esterase